MRLARLDIVLHLLVLLLRDLTFDVALIENPPWRIRCRAVRRIPTGTTTTEGLPAGATPSTFSPAARTSEYPAAEDEHQDHEEKRHEPEPVQMRSPAVCVFHVRPPFRVSAGVDESGSPRDTPFR